MENHIEQVQILRIEDGMHYLRLQINGPLELWLSHGKPISSTIRMNTDDCLFRGEQT